MSSSRFVAAVFLAVLMGIASAQTYPDKPIRILTSAAGGGSDFTARLIAQGISGPLGQQVIVDNRVSLVATETALKAKPDGYTMLVGGASIWIFPLMQKVTYDVVRDFAPITLISTEPSILAVHPAVPANSVKELIALAKARPGELNYSSGQAGSPNHLGPELLKAMAGVNIVRVAYKGLAPTITALLGGEVQMTITDVGPVMPHVKAGKLRALAVTSAQPSVLAPGLPTVAASGLPGYEWIGMTHLLAPAETPVTIVHRLNQEVVRFLKTTDAKEKFSNAGAEIVGNSPEQFGAIIKADIARMDKVIKDAGIKLD